MFRNPSRFKLLRPSTRAWMLASVCAAGLFALVPTVSQAALIDTSACDASALRQPFLRWADSHWYKLVPGGDFEGSLSGWTLKGRASKVAGSEPYAATGSAGHWSISLPAGSSAQSPLTCVNAGYPAFRFFGRNSTLLSTVLVQVLYNDPVLGLVPLPVGIVALTPGWQPTLRMLTGSLVGGALAGGTAQIAIRFTALTGTSQIDDVYVDPRMKG